MTTDRTPTAIDPLALILSNAVYVKINLPYPPPEIKEAIRATVQRLNGGERRVFLEAVRNLGTIVKTFEGELQQGAEVERAQVQAR
jgi:hypothetical protein